MFDFKNRFDFFLRNKIKLSRKNYFEPNESKDDLEFSDVERELESKLINRYHLQSYYKNSTIINYCQNLYLLSIFDKYLNIKTNDKLSVLDIGSKNWYYAPAEYYFFKKYSESISLDGVEIDAYRLYSNFYNRFEVAKFYTKDLKGTKYIPDNLMNINKQYNYIIWILPFVLIQPLRYWGLPDKYFQPQELFNYAYSLMNKNGKMLIINQTKEEYEAQQKIIAGLKSYSEKLDSLFYKYKQQRYVTIVEK